MKSVQLTCNRCNAMLHVERAKGYSKITCPYCGNYMQLIFDSDMVRTTEIKADVAKAEIELAYREHRDRLRFTDRMMLARIVIIGITTVIVFGLIGMAIVIGN